MGASQQFSLRWNNYIHHITSAFDNLRTCEDLVDVTLICDRKKIYAHKMLLSACSEYFRDVFKENPCKHPVVIFRNVKYEDLLAIIDFMYHGEVNVEQEQLTSFLTTAEMLAVQGLSVGSSPPKEEVRKRKSIFLDSPSIVPGNNDNSSRTVLPRRAPSSRIVSPPPVPPPQPRSPPRKRGPSPTIQANDIEKSLIKKRVPETPKVEASEPEGAEPGSISEDDGMMDVSELDINRDGTEHEHSDIIKEEPLTLPDELDEKLSALERTDRAGTSANPEAAGSFKRVEYEEGEMEEYLEEEDDDDQSYTVVVDEQGKQYLMKKGVEVDDEEEEEGTIIFEEVKVGEDSEDEGEVVMVDADDCDYDEGGVELIYAEAVNDNNEVIIGPAPTFQCDQCPRSFKRQDSLLKHVKMHTGRTVCPVCNHIFSRVGHLTRHIKQKHPEFPLVIRRGRPRRVH